MKVAYRGCLRRHGRRAGRRLRADLTSQVPAICYAPAAGSEVNKCRERVGLLDSQCLDLGEQHEQHLYSLRLTLS